MVLFIVNCNASLLSVYTCYIVYLGTDGTSKIHIIPEGEEWPHFVLSSLRLAVIIAIMTFIG